MCFSFVKIGETETETASDRRAILNRGVLRRRDRDERKDPTAGEEAAVRDIEVNAFFDPLKIITKTRRRRQGDCMGNQSKNNEKLC